MAKKITNKKIVDYLKVYKWHLLFVLLCLLITSSSILVMSHSMGYLIDKAIVSQNKRMLDVGMMYFLAISLTLAVATGLRFAFITLTGEYVIRDIRKDLYSKILELSPHFYESSSAGDILSRLNTDTTLLQSVISSSISVTLRNSIMLVGSIIMLAVQSIKLTAMILCLVPIAIAPIMLLSQKLKKFAKEYQEKIAALATETEETVSFIKIVQAYTNEPKHYTEFGARLLESITVGRLRIKTRALLTVIVICIVFGGIGFVLWVGSMDVLTGRLTPGQLSTFIFLSLICATTSMSIMEGFSEIQKGAGAANRIFEFLSNEAEIKDPKEPLLIPQDAEMNIEFDNVSFNYLGSQKTIKNLSFIARHGEMVAIVGESGAGKSTIMNLILRFYDISAGHITVGGVDISKLSLSGLRSNFGYVGQDSAIFSASVYENIIYGNPRATTEEVVKAAKDASAYGFIKSLPQGFDTFLGTKGSKLSGGQKQRIAIARAILKNPKILLLDEATSALDAKNESLVQKALDQLIKNRTTIVIAHRMSTVVNADKIIVMHNGEAIAFGSHKSLMAESRDYRALFEGKKDT